MPALTSLEGQVITMYRMMAGDVLRFVFVYLILQAAARACREGEGEGEGEGEEGRGKGDRAMGRGRERVRERGREGREGGRKRGRDADRERLLQMQRVKQISGRKCFEEGTRIQTRILFLKPYAHGRWASGGPSRSSSRAAATQWDDMSNVLSHLVQNRAAGGERWGG